MGNFVLGATPWTVPRTIPALADAAKPIESQPMKRSTTLIRRVACVAILPSFYLTFSPPDRVARDSLTRAMCEMPCLEHEGNWPCKLGFPALNIHATLISRECNRRRRDPARGDLPNDWLLGRACNGSSRTGTAFSLWKIERDPISRGKTFSGQSWPRISTGSLSRRFRLQCASPWWWVNLRSRGPTRSGSRCLAA
jgi:hypothetical protein